MRVAHLTLFGPEPGQCTGIIHKLERYAYAAHAEGLPLDFHAVLTESNQPESPGDFKFLQLQTVPGTNPFAIRARQCRVVRRLLNDYDRIVLRYPSVDPVCLLRIPETHRIILEHHAKEVELLRRLPDRRWLLEKALGPWWIRRFRALTAVTPEIVEYERKRARFSHRTAYFPNSIPLELCPVAEGPIRAAEDTVTRIAFLVARQFPWHGLEEIVLSLGKTAAERPVEFHVAGQLDASVRAKLEPLPFVHHHPSLTMSELGDFYARMHVALGSFNLERGAGLRQATPLKIREALAHGVPVVYGYDDPALPDEFEFHQRQDVFDATEVIGFVDSLASRSRQEVCDAARPFIDARTMMRDLYQFAVANEAIDSLGESVTEAC